MSAEEFGRRLLGEVQVVSMDKVLSTLLASHGSRSEVDLGVPQIERLLCSAQTPGAKGAANIDRSSSRITPVTVQGGTRSSSSIIELASTSSGAGKTQLLYLLASKAVLPSVKTDRALQRANKTIVVFDVDDRFNIERLALVLREQIRTEHKTVSSNKSTVSDMTEEDGITEGISEPAVDEQLSDRQIDDFVESSLRHVHVFRPQSLQALVAGLTDLGTYLTSFTSHFSGDRHVSAILLDSASAFYWQHRADEDAAQLRKIEGTRNPHVAAAPPLYTRLQRALQEAQQQFGCHIIYTALCSQPLKENIASVGRSFDYSVGQLGLRPLLPASWSGHSTLQLLLQRTRIPKFAIGMGAKEAWTDRDMRWEAAKTGNFSASVIDAEGGGRKAFDFVVDAEGVHIEDGLSRSGQPLDLVG